MTRGLMWSSAVFLAALGLAASFAPHELASYAGTPADAFTVTVIQLAGAAWIAFALVNWSARGTMLGGIYGRPIALGNFAHFAIGAIVLLKVAGKSGMESAGFAITAAYCVFAAAFGWALFVRDPLPK